MFLEIRKIIAVILCFLLMACSSQFRGSGAESQALSHMNQAAELENSSAYHQAAQEYAMVAEQYPFTQYYKTAVWKTAMLNIHPSNSQIDYNAALTWLHVYLELPLSAKEKTRATVYVGMIEHINDLETQISSLIKEKNCLQEVLQKQTGIIETANNQSKKLKTELTLTRDELKKLKAVDVQMHKSRVNNSTDESIESPQNTLGLNAGKDRTEQLGGHNALFYQGDHSYLIQVSSYTDKEASVRAAMRLREKGNYGLVSHVHIPEKGDWYRVFVGFYQSFEAAQKAALELKKHAYPLAFVVKMPFAIQIGIFSSGEELKKLEAELQSKGYLTYHMPYQPDNNKIRLLVGVFRTEKEAEKLAKVLQKEGYTPKVVQR